MVLNFSLFVGFTGLEGNIGYGGGGGGGGSEYWGAAAPQLLCPCNMSIANLYFDDLTLAVLTPPINCPIPTALPCNSNYFLSGVTE